MQQLRLLYSMKRCLLYGIARAAAQLHGVDRAHQCATFRECQTNRITYSLSSLSLTCQSAGCTKSKDWICCSAVDSGHAVSVRHVAVAVMKLNPIDWMQMIAVVVESYSLFYGGDASVQTVRLLMY